MLIWCVHVLQLIYLQMNIAHALHFDEYLIMYLQFIGASFAMLFDWILSLKRPHSVWKLLFAFNHKQLFCMETCLDRNCYLLQLETVMDTLVL